MKTLKNHIKKSISLFLAVLMVLSCWVWVAPEKAEAAETYDEGKYYVKYVIGTIREAGNSGNWSGNTLTISYKHSDGTTGSVTKNLTKSKYETQDATEVVIWEGYIDGFPTSAGWYMKMGFKAGNSVYLSVGDCNLYVGRDEASCNTIVTATDGFKWQQDATGQGTKDATFTINTDKNWPQAAEIKPTENIGLNIPALGSGGTDQKTGITTTVYDQYGVKLSGVAPTSYWVGDENGNTYTSEQGIWGTISGSKGVVTVNENAQKNIEGVALTKTSYAYLYAGYTGTSIYGATSSVGLSGNADELQRISEITLNYPEYEVKVNPQEGSIKNFNASMSISDGTTQSNAWTGKAIYGATPTFIPTGDASATGYNFKGYWTKKQPSTGAANWYEYESNFAEPISDDEFEAYKINGYTANGDYITVDGKTYYKAGVAWDAENIKVNGKIEYFGWWLATEIPAKFYDIDGKYLGTKNFKYGKAHSSDDYFDPTPEYNEGAYTYKSFKGVWRDITGATVTEGSYLFGVHNPEIESFVLTPVYSDKSFKNQYTLKFINPLTGLVSTSSVFDYRHIVIEGQETPVVTVPAALTQGWDYSYEFAGWSTEVPTIVNASTGRPLYHAIDADEVDSFVNKDWVVRGDATYYPVFKTTIKKYVVAFQYKDATGKTVTSREELEYGSAIVTPEHINRTYAEGGMGYTLQGWNYKETALITKLLESDKSIVLNNTNLNLMKTNEVGNAKETAFVFTAAYGDGIPMPYSITFKYKNGKGEDRQYSESVQHGSNITQEIVDRLIVPETYDDGEAEYTFANKWIVTEGSVKDNKTEYTAEELLSFSPTSNVIFEAVYGEGVPFYYVTYIDGFNTFKERVLKGSNVPEWTYDINNDNGTPDDASDDYKETKVYVPADKELETGINRFAGWYDAKQEDPDCKETNGKKYTTADTVESDLTLYAQYKYEAYRYSIIFLGHDGTQLGDAYVEAGQSYAFAFDRATKAAQTRQPDETYSYEFIGWDQPYNENKTCEGKDIVFTALYKPSFIYYNAKWYNDKDAMNNGADPVITTKHTYDSAIYNPAVALTAPAGKHFAGWYYLVDGEAVAFHRGMKITSDMSFFADYEKDDVVYTITTIVKGETATYAVGENEPAKVVPTPVSGYVDEYKHDKFVGWYTSADFAEGSEFAIDTAVITGDITLYAKFAEEDHKIDQFELIDVPTYYKEGKVERWCACAKKATLQTEITTLTDKVAPTGTIYLGSGKWSSTDAQSGAADTNKYYANKNTDVVITINDKGDVNDAYNPTGAGIGIKMIRVFVSSDTFTQDQQGIAAQLATTIFTDNSQVQNNIANYTVKLSELKIADLDADGKVQYNDDGSIKSKDLEDGKTYIIYYYAVDKANNILNKNVRTAVFKYDTTVPEFVINGKNNAEYTTGTVTYCGSAVISNVEVGAVVTVNGKEVTLTSTSAAGIGSYTINKAGNYIITVTDMAGNKVTKKIKVAEDHNKVTTIVKSTCDADGYKKVECALCKTVIEHTIYTAPGHEWSYSAVAATCEAAGYNVKTCEECGKSEKVYTYTNELGEEVAIAPQLEHVYNKDENNNIIYTVVTKSTCTVEGSEVAKCQLCGKAELTKTIPVDTENGHLYGGVKALAATCTETGKTYKTCKYCYNTLDVNVLPATGHTEYTEVTKEATCDTAGEKVTYCKKCTEYTVKTEEIPATGRHIAVVVETKDPAVGVKGYIKYECDTCETWKKTVEIDELVAYTINFVDESGKNIVAFKDVVAGTTIANVAEPTKAADATYSYTFAGWADESGKIYELPFDASNDLTLKATFKATKNIYTHIFMVPTKWVATLADSADYGYVTYATIMGAYNSTNKKPSTIPTFVDADANTDEALKASADINFKGWANSDGVIVTDFTMAGDDTFYAVFEAVPHTYNAVFYNYDGAYLGSTEVSANGTASYNGATPERASDDVNEYSFKGWTVDGKPVNLETYAITGKTRFVAEFTAKAHNFVIVEDESWAATCKTAGQETKECTNDNCDYTIVKEIPLVEEHDYEVQADGSKICSICGDIVLAETKFYTITFVDSEGNKLKEIPLAEGKTTEYTAEAEKLTVDKVYTFKNWTDAEGNIVSETTTLKVTVGADATYTANYDSAVRYYRVVYYGYTYTDYIADYVLPYGTQINTIVVEADGSKNLYAPQPTIETADGELDNWHNETSHYIFTGKWIINNGAAVEKVSGTVTGDMDIRAEFNVGTHDYVYDITDATCTEAGGKVQVCKVDGCEMTATTSESIPALGHQKTNAKVTEKADVGVDGKVEYTCDRCGTTYTEVIPGLRGKDMKIKVFDLNGDDAEQATIKLYYNNGDGEKLYKVYYTGATGTISVQVPADYKNWRATVEFDGGSYSGEVKTGSAENVFGGPKTEEPEAECPCTCHKNTFWGAIYRFFQKIFAIFGAKPCCHDQEK